MQQHWQAAAEWACASHAVEFHLFLLRLHGVFLSGIFLVDFLHVGSQQAHLGLRNVALVRQWEQHHLEQYGEHQNCQAHIAANAGEPVEHRNHDVGVNPAEQCPAERHQAIEVEVLAVAIFVVALEQLKLVRAKENLEIGRVFIGRIIFNRGVKLHILVIVGVEGAVFVDRLAFHLCALEALVGNKHAREELILEAHPLDVAGGFLVVG